MSSVLADIDEFERYLQGVRDVDLSRWTALRESLERQLRLDEAARPTTRGKNRFPKPGDKIMAHYVGSWQYFDATVDSYDPSNMSFHISWDDQDSAGRTVAVKDVALNQPPDEDDVGVGSEVLFCQGSYVAHGGRAPGKRWHLGLVTDIREGPGGGKLYDGRHAKGAGDGKMVRYRDYSETFTSLSLGELRMAPNALEAVEAGGGAVTGGDAVDIYFSFSPKDCATLETSPRRIAQGLLERVQGASSNLGRGNAGSESRALMIQSSRVVVAFISDEYAKDAQCRDEFQYARKTLQHPLVPVVVGQGFAWSKTVIGLLIAGELYIHFSATAPFNDKLAELQGRTNSYLQSGTPGAAAAVVPARECDVFLSYCWLNSQEAAGAQQVSRAVGDAWSDPRRIKADLERLHGLAVWLDVEQLGRGSQEEQSAGLYEQITEGLVRASVVVACVSGEYAGSTNCRMEFQYAAKTLHMPLVPLTVGTSSSWRETTIGLILSEATTGGNLISFQRLSGEKAYLAKLDMVKKAVDALRKRSTVVKPEPLKPAKNSKAPVPGDHVISHWRGGQYFFSTVVSFSPESLTYLVDWDDGDSTGREVKFDVIARDVPPEASDIGLGTCVLFPQGQYKLNREDDHYSGYRYFRGQVTSKRQQQGDTWLYSGQHTAYTPDTLPTMRGVQFTFEDYPLERLRLAPNAFDAIQQAAPR